MSDPSSLESTGTQSEATAETRAEEAASSSVSLRGGFIGLAAGAVIATLAQLAAPFFDYQNANIIASVAMGVAGVWFLWSLQRKQAASGHRYRVPGLLVSGIAAFLVCFEFVGFSGEMFPLFRWRFRSAAALQSAPPMPGDAEVPANPKENEVGGRSYPQFLGPDRDGVIASREFAIPESIEQVERVWDIGVGEGWSSFAIADGRAITLEQRDKEEWLTCYRLGDGQMLWALQHPARHEHLMGGVGPRSTPTIHQSFVYATTATGLLWCVDLNGQERWTKNLLELAGWTQLEFEQAAPWGYSISPLIIDDLCVVALGGPVGGEQSASLIALDAMTGEERWRAGDDQLSYASPVAMRLDGQRQIVSVNEKTVSGHAIDNGDVLWTFSWPGSTNTGANCASAVPVGDDQLLVGKGYGGGSSLVQVTSADGGWQVQEVWHSNRVLQTKFNHTCVSGGVGYAIGNGALQAVALGEPSRLWQQPRRQRAGQGQVILVEDLLVLQDEGGDVVLVDATSQEYRERLRLPALESKTWNIPSVAGRYVIVRNSEQAICFRLPPR